MHPAAAAKSSPFHPKKKGTDRHTHTSECTIDYHDDDDYYYYTLDRFCVQGSKEHIRV